ncbi:hypothetical protein ACJX0J_012362, partial [Zea mays]
KRILPVGKRLFFFRFIVCLIKLFGLDINESLSILLDNYLEIKPLSKNTFSIKKDK